MKNLALPLLFSITLLSGSLINGQTMSLLPSPKRQYGEMTNSSLKEQKSSVSSDLLDREQAAISQFTQFIREKTGISIYTTFAEELGTQIIVLKSDQQGDVLPVPDEKTGPGSRESYLISVSKDKVLVNAKSDAGIFYALQTLEQMIAGDNSNSYILQAEIEDYPEMAYRGVMVDFSHGGLLTEQEIMNQIDFLARWKMNQYYFYNEVSIEMKGYPLDKL